MKRNYKKRIVVWLRIAGWTCLIPASAYLLMCQASGNMFFMLFVLISILFGVYLLVNAKAPRWQNTRAYIGPVCFGVLFVALLPAIFLLLAQYSASKLKKG